MSCEQHCNNSHSQLGTGRHFSKDLLIEEAVAVAGVAAD